MNSSILKPWPWVNFTRQEMQCKETSECRMIMSFMDRLEALRIEYNKPMIVTSGYRSRYYSAEQKKTRASTHAMGVIRKTQESSIYHHRGLSSWIALPVTSKIFTFVASHH